MKKLTFLLATLFLLTISPRVEAAQYCGEAVNLGGLNGSQNYCNFNLTCEKRSNTEYVVIATITKEGCTFKADAYNSLRNPWKKGDGNYYDIASYCVLSNSNKTLTVTFPWEPQFTANGSALALLTVQGKDSYGNNANWGCPMPTDITWGTCAPASGLSITSATAGNITNTSADITVEAADTEGNINKVIIKNGSTVLLTQSVTPTTSLDATYTITGLYKNTAYNLTVEVSDDASNTETKTVSFTTANNLESECSGTRGPTSSGTGAPDLDYEIMYDGKDINFTIQSLDNSKQLSSCEIKWAISTNENTTNTLSTTIVDGVANAVLTGRNKGDILYIYFTYKAGTMGSATNTANGTNWSSNRDKLIYYVVGDCLPPANVPYLTYATLKAVASTTVTLDVDGIINIDNQAVKITQFEVKYGSTTRVLNITPEGTITIDGLSPDTEYNFTIKAAYNTARSENEEHIQAITASLTDNLAFQKPTTVGYDQTNAHLIVDGDLGNRWSSNGRPNINSDWVKVDLGEIYYINSVKIKWETACPVKYQILLSMDGTNWFVWQHNEAPTPNQLTNYAIGGLAARYIKVVSQENATGYGISIYELQAFGTGISYAANTSAPTLTASLEEVNYSQAIINVSATDNQDTPITIFEIDGIIYHAVDGKITINNLSYCQYYDWYIYAIDQEGNKSNSVQVKCNTTDPAPGTNIALNKPVYAGFYEGELLPKYAVDGDNKTRWGARFRPTGEDEWLVVDLEGIYQIDSILVAWETGTSINYEFKTALDATIITCEKQGVNDDKTLQPVQIYNRITSGNFSTFEHKTDQPESAKQGSNDKDNAANDNRAWDKYEYTEPVIARYIQLKSGLIAAYPASLWEFQVFGKCAEKTDKPVMQWAEVVSIEDDAAEIYVSALDEITSEENMKYEVLLTGGEDGHFQLTTTYNFEPEHFVDGYTGHILLGGLLPYVPYEAKIYAIDEDGNKSENYKTISFSTHNATGCVFASKEAFNIAETGNHSTQIFQKGYRVLIETGNNAFTITAHTEDDFWSLTDPYVQVLDNPSNPEMSGVKEFKMTAVEGEERTYTKIITSSDITWSGTVTFFIKFPFNNGGICLTQPITYSIEDGCLSPFIIYHHDDQPTSEAPTSSNETQINVPIKYYRHFQAGVWEDITLPFQVDSILVYDVEDHQYYNLKAQYKDGSTTHKGKFLLRKQEDNVSGADFVNSWQDGNSPLPIKNQPYAIRFTSNYYEDKYLVFCGAKNQTITTSFTLGEAPTEDDQYTVYGNPTMQTQSVGKAYLLPADHSDETYRLVENAEVHPFEAYVLANQNTMKVMSKVAPWRGTPNITTGWDNIEYTLLPQDLVTIYTITGQRVGTWYNISLQDAADQWTISGKTGCYFITAGTHTVKLVIQ